MTPKTKRRKKPKYTPTEARRRVEEFAAVAQEYCDLVERVGKIRKKAFVIRALEIIPRLIVQADRLPDLRQPTNLPPLPKSWREWGMKADYNGIHKLFGRDQQALEVFDPFNLKDKAEAFPLAVDVGDSYDDLRKNLDFYLVDPARNWRGAGYKWRESYLIHYRAHLTSALYFLCILSSKNYGVFS